MMMVRRAYGEDKSVAEVKHDVLVSLVNRHHHDDDGVNNELDSKHGIGLSEAI